MAIVRIGISGWTYVPWRGTFFPPGLRQRDELSYASARLSTIEVNGTFYSLQQPRSYARWYAETPASFMFSVKAPRFITHVRRLKDCAQPLANFFASGILQLREKTGPILWQLPPSFRFDEKRLDQFLTLLPRTAEAAVKLARRHDQKVAHTYIRTDENRPLRHALEIRHRSFVEPKFIRLLHRHRVALVVADTAGKWPLMEDVTADFVYVRLHGDKELYASGYTPTALRAWAKKTRAWQKGGNPPGASLTGSPAAKRRNGRDVFVYFDNDVKVRAPYDAMTLAHLLKTGPKPEASPHFESGGEQPRRHWSGHSTGKRRKKKPSPAVR